MTGRAEFERAAALLNIDAPPTLRPSDRVLPSWMQPSFIATAAAQEKLRTWAQTHGREAWEQHVDPEQLAQQLHAFCDPVWAAIVGWTLARLPPPAREYLAARVTWIGIGLRIGGYCCAPIDLADRPWVILLSPTRGRDDRALVGLTIHEATHAWLIEESTVKLRSNALTAHTIAAVDLAKIARDLHEEVLQYRAIDARDEKQTEALAADWMERVFANL